MRQLETLLMFLLVLLFAASLAAATDTQRDASSYLDARPSVHDVINGQAGAAVQLSSSHGKELRKEFACYEIADSYCAVFPDAFRSPVTCCKDSESYRHEGSSISDRVFPQAAVGTCEVRVVDNTMLQVSGPPAVLSWGAFLATCNLLDKAETCGPSGCGDLVLSAQGITYLLDVVMATPPPARTPECPIINRREGAAVPAAPRSSSPRQKRSDASGNGAPTRNTATPVATASAQHRRDADLPANTMFYLGSVFVYTGPLSVASKTHEPQWEKGWFDLIVPNGAFTPVTLANLQAAEAAQGAPFPRVDPEDLWRYKVEFFEKSREQF